MITIRSGSTPRRCRPRSAATSAVIANCRCLLLQGLHRDIRPSTAQHSLDLPPIHAIVGDHHQRRGMRAGHASEAHVAPSIPENRAVDRAHHAMHVAAVVQRLSRPADEFIGMMARLDVAAANQPRMPCHHERITGRRHHTHAADRQLNGQPSPPRRSCRAIAQRSRRSARSVSSIPRRATMTCCWAAYAISI